MDDTIQMLMEMGEDDYAFAGDCSEHEYAPRPLISLHEQQGQEKQQQCMYPHQQEPSLPQQQHQQQERKPERGEIGRVEQHHQGVNTSSSSAIVVPIRGDILDGRGISNADNPGNQRFYAVIDQYVSEYKGLNEKQEKSRVIQCIYDIMCTSGRFLKMDATSGACVLTPVAEAKKKIGHALRYRIRHPVEGQEASMEQDDGLFSDAELASVLGNF